MDKVDEDHLQFKNNPKITKMLDKNEEILLSAMVYKFNKRCKRQERSLLITNRAIYNINDVDFLTKALSVFSSSAMVKRRIDIKKLTAVSISSASSEFVLHVIEEYDYRFSSLDKRDRILNAILKSYYSNIKDRQLPFYFKDEPLLTDITTTEDDKKVGISRMPKEKGMGMDEEKLREKFKEMILAKEKLKAQTETVYTRGKNGKVSLDDFEILKVLGRGAFGKVMLVEKRDSKQVYAIKAMHKDEIIDKDQVEHTKTEKYVLQNSKSPFVVSLEYAFQTPEKLFFVMKFMRGGELFQHLRQCKRFEEKRAKFYAAQILLALEHLHEMNVVYRDLKPENILMDEFGHVCLADFGMSKVLKKGQKTKSFVGTPEYLAPEMVDSRGHDFCSDWWALGILIFEMLMGYPPFYLKGQSTQKMFAAIKDKPVDFGTKVKLSEDAKSIIRELLDKNLDTRLGAKGSAEIKEHKWFEDINWADMYERKINPPFKPKLNGELDVGNFDTEFTREDPSHSIAPPTNMRLIKKHEDDFTDFSYAPEKNILSSDDD